MKPNTHELATETAWGKQHLCSHGIKLLVDFLDVLQISDELPYHTAIQLAEYLTTLQQVTILIRNQGSTGSTQELQGSSSRSTPCPPCLKINLLDPSFPHCKIVRAHSCIL